MWSGYTSNNYRCNTGGTFLSVKKTVYNYLVSQIALDGFLMTARTRRLQLRSSQCHNQSIGEKSRYTTGNIHYGPDLFRM